MSLTLTKPLSPQARRWVTPLILGVLFLGLAVIHAQIKRYAPIIDWDWRGSYRPAALNVLHGQSPYVNGGPGGFYNPPWMILPYLPFALLPDWIGSSLFFAANYLIFFYLATRMTKRPWLVLAFTLSYPVWKVATFGQVDGFVLLGMVLPPWAGLILLLGKPQVGLGIGIFYAWQAWRKGGIKQLLLTVGPVSALYGLSFLIFGLYPIQRMDELLAGGWNFSLLPLGLVIGAYLLVLGLRKSNQHIALAASPFFSPYVTLMSYTGPLLGLLGEEPWAALAACLASWLIGFWW